MRSAFSERPADMVRVSDDVTAALLVLWSPTPKPPASTPCSSSVVAIWKAETSRFATRDRNLSAKPKVVADILAAIEEPRA